MLRNRRVKYIFSCIAVLVVLFIAGGWIASLFTDLNDYSYITLTFLAKPMDSNEEVSGDPVTVRIPRFNGNRNNPSMQYLLTQDDEELNYYKEGHNFFRWRLDNGSSEPTYYEAGRTLPSGFYNDITLVAEWGEWTSDMFSWTGPENARKLSFTNLGEEEIHVPAVLWDSDYSVMRNVVRIPLELFKDNTDVKYISLPVPNKPTGQVIPGISNIDNSAFSGCVNLEWTNIPSSVDVAQISAYDNTKQIKHVSVSFGNGKYSYSQGVLFDKQEDGTPKRLYKLFTNIQKYIVPEGVERINTRAFDSSNLRSISLPSTLTNIEAYAFVDSQYLETIEIPSGVSAIESHAFAGCIRLKRVTIPKSVREIQVNAFLNCTGLQTLTLHDNFTSIHQDSFRGAINLHTIYIPAINYDDQLAPTIRYKVLNTSPQQYLVQGWNRTGGEDPSIEKNPLS